MVFWCSPYIPELNLIELLATGSSYENKNQVEDTSLLIYLILLTN